MSMTNDVEVPTIKGAAADYWARVKAGDIGSLPAVLGLIVLCLVFGIRILKTGLATLEIVISNDRFEVLNRSHRAVAVQDGCLGHIG